MDSLKAPRDIPSYLIPAQFVKMWSAHIESVQLGGVPCLPARHLVAPRSHSEPSTLTICLTSLRHSCSRSVPSAGKHPVRPTASLITRRLPPLSTPFLHCQNYPLDCLPAQVYSDGMRKKNPIAVALGKLGAKKGGLARAKKLTAEQLSAIGKLGAKARWKKRKKS